MGVKDYDILHAVTLEEMKAKVKTALAEGWEPLGSVMVTNFNNSYMCDCILGEKILYYQVMVRKGEPS